MRDAHFYITKDFHCWNLYVEAGRSSYRDSSRNGKKRHKNYIAGYISLTAMPSMGFGRKFGN